MSQELNALESALLGSSFDNDNPIVVKAEDIQQNSGIDFSKHFFEPQPGNSYLIKFLPNPKGDLITHRSVYRSLPDPERKGKTFQYISSGSAKTCKVLDLFFELNSKKKEGDVVAEKKIEKYLSRTNQACTLVQILNSPNKEEIGNIRLFVFSTFGVNATVANLVNGKLNPTKQQLEDGFEREDIFNIFNSPVLSLICEEGVYNGVKGRDFSKSSWAPKNRGAIAINGSESREFKASDYDGKVLSEEAKSWFQTFLAQITNPDYDVIRYFAYKTENDERLDEETRNYINSVFKKVDEIVPVIRDMSLQEIANYGKSDNSVKKSDTNNSENIMEAAIPEELKETTVAQTVHAPTETVHAPTANSAGIDDEIDAIIGS